MSKEMIGQEKRGEVFLMDPDKVILNEEKNGRNDPHDDDAIDELVQSFREQGQLQPVVGRKLPDGHLEIVLGFRRTMAARRLNEQLKAEGKEPQWLKVMVRQMNNLEAFKANITENRHRKQVSALDDAHNQNVLRVTHSMNNTEIGAFYGMAPQRVSQLSRLLLLNEEIKHKVHKGLITIGDAFALSEVSEEEQLKLVAEAEEQQRKFVEEEAAGKAMQDTHIDTTPEKVKKNGKGKGKGKKLDIKKTIDAKKVKPPKADGAVGIGGFKEFLEACKHSSSNTILVDIANMMLDFMKGQQNPLEFQDTLEEYLANNMPGVGQEQDAERAVA